MAKLGILRRALYEPPFHGWQALLAGLILIAVPTLIRAAVLDVLTLGVFLTYVPSVVIAAVLLRGRDAAMVAILCAFVADFVFLKPHYALAADGLFSTGMFLLISALVIVIVKGARRHLRESLSPSAEDSSERLVFSERSGEAWAHWSSDRPSVKLGPRKQVAEMMEDYIAQIELGERLNGGRSERGSKG